MTRALVWASANEHLEVINFLLDNGANVFADDNYILNWVKFNERQAVIELLENYHPINRIKSARKIET